MNDYKRKPKEELLQIIDQLQKENEILRKKSNRGGGRSPALTEEEVEKVIKLYNDGFGVTYIIRELQLTCSSMTVSRVIRKYKDSLKGSNVDN